MVDDLGCYTIMHLYISSPYSSASQHTHAHTEAVVLQEDDELSLRVGDITDVEQVCLVS